MTRMSGAGNTFCLVDNTDLAVRDLAGHGRDLCRRWRTDGALYAEPSASCDIRMRIINADGSEAEMCGNGVRCFARFVRDRGLVAKDGFRVETLAGPVEVLVLPDGQVRARLTPPKDLRLHIALHLPEYTGPAHFLNTGVPHTVVLVDDLDSVDAVRVGRAIRHADLFAPAGTNANFVQVLDRRTIRVRTYERGVEDETLACGTGSTASAIVTALLGHTEPPVAVLTRGGETLTVEFHPHDTLPSTVTLQGPVVYLPDQGPTP